MVIITTPTTSNLMFFIYLRLVLMCVIIKWDQLSHQSLFCHFYLYTLLIVDNSLTCISVSDLFRIISILHSWPVYLNDPYRSGSKALNELLHLSCFFSHPVAFVATGVGAEASWPQAMLIQLQIIIGVQLVLVYCQLPTYICLIHYLSPWI